MDETEEGARDKKKWKGLNLLGRALMKTRARIKEEEEKKEKAQKQEEKKKEEEKIKKEIRQEETQLQRQIRDKNTAVIVFTTKRDTGRGEEKKEEDKELEKIIKEWPEMEPHKNKNKNAIAKKKAGAEGGERRIVYAYVKEEIISRGGMKTEINIRTLGRALGKIAKNLIEEGTRKIILRNLGESGDPIRKIGMINEIKKFKERIEKTGPKKTWVREEGEKEKTQRTTEGAEEKIKIGLNQIQERGEWIANICCKNTRTPKGLTKKIFQKYRTANTYANGENQKARIGTAEIKNEEKIINLYAQWEPGKPKAERGETEEKRLKWLERAIKSMEQQIEKGDGKTIINLPEGAGAAGEEETWKKMREILRKHNEDPKAKTAWRVVEIEEEDKKKKNAKKKEKEKRKWIEIKSKKRKEENGKK